MLEWAAHITTTVITTMLLSISIHTAVQSAASLSSWRHWSIQSVRERHILKTPCSQTDRWNMMEHREE